MKLKIKKWAKPVILQLRFFSCFIKLALQFIRINQQVGSSQSIRALAWTERKFSSPAPNFVKWNVLLRWGEEPSVWIETGTYLGETTEQLGKFASKIISIEPSKELAKRAEKNFAYSSNIEIVLGTSEEKLNAVLENLSENEKTNINYWLDGHYSAGMTYMGELECPIIKELEIIDRHIYPQNLPTIFIDDVRVFSPYGKTRSGYPSLTYLVNWADERGFYWTIEHDIFIMTAKNLYY